MADDVGGAAAPAPAPADAPAPAPAAPAPAPASVLGGGAAPAPAPAAPAGDSPFGSIPEKFHVKNEDGSPNLNASWAKVEEHRSHLEKRLGAGDLPPKTADEYKVNVPEALAEKIKAEDLGKDEAFKTMLAGAHAQGFSQKQVDFMVGEFLDRSMKLQGGLVQLSVDDCSAALKAEWKTDADYQAGVQAAYRAGQAYGDIDKLMAKYGNDPDFIRFAANVGKELSEDTGTPNGGQSMSEADVESLQKSQAYWQPNHPDHANTKAKVDRYYAAKFGDKPKQTGAMAFTSALG